MKLFCLWRRHKNGRYPEKETKLENPQKLIVWPDIKDCKNQSICHGVLIKPRTDRVIPNALLIKKKT